MLQASRVYFSYDVDSEPVIRDLSCEVPSGTSIAIRGANGSGKSTLGLILCGAIPAVFPGLLRGSVAWRGEIVGKHLFPKQSGLLFQNPLVYFAGYTIADEAQQIGEGAQRFLEIADRLLGPAGYLTPLHQLSIGQQQLLSLASITLRLPDIIVLDEPFSYLDEAHLEVAVDLIKGSVSRGAAVIVLLSDDPHKEEGTFSDCYTLEDGKLKPMGTPKADASGHSMVNESIQDKEMLAFDGVYFSQTAGYAAPFIANLSWEVNCGESLGIVGANGIGKTTILTLAGGLRRPSKGRIKYRGVPALSNQLLKNVRCALQNPDHQLLGGTVRQEILTGLEWLGVNDSIIEQRVDSLGKDLPFSLERCSDSLSFGQRKLLSIVAAFATECPVVVLDEPFSEVDSVNRKLIVRLAERHLAQGHSLIVAAHEERTMRSLCHRYIRLSR